MFAIKGALSMDDRRALFIGGRTPLPSSYSTEALLTLWREYLGGGERLDQRLALDGRTLADTADILANPDAIEVPLPDWVTFWDEFAESAERSASSQETPAIPFATLLAPVADFALASLRAICPAMARTLRESECTPPRPGAGEGRRERSERGERGPSLGNPGLAPSPRTRSRSSRPSPALGGGQPSGCALTESALDDLRNALLERLAHLAAPSLHRLFVDFAARRDVRRLFMDAEDLDVEGTETFDAFTESVRSEGLARALLNYPVLLRLMGEHVCRWRTATAEMLERLASDRSALNGLFAGGAEAGRVTRIEPDLSDPHHGGRTVAALTLESGLKLIYKPRDLRIEAEWSALLAWLNTHMDVPHYRLKTSVRDGYGWVEMVEPAGCADADAARRYYRRCGSLLALIYALSGTDCHYQNLVAHGEYPVLVDLETLLHPPTQLWANQPVSDRARGIERLLSSVLTTGFLPAWFQDDGGCVFDASALGATEAAMTGYEAWVCEHANTDRMRVTLRPGRTAPVANIARLKGDALCPRDYLEDLVTGFRRTCEVLIANRETLLREDGPVSALSRCTHRLILRQTPSYALLLNRMLHPENLKDGVRFSLCAEALGRSWLSIADPDVRRRMWAIFRAEKQAVLRMDVPCFCSSGDGLALRDGGQVVVKDFLWDNTWSRIRQRLHRLDEAEVALQEQYIRELFRARYGIDGAETEATRSRTGTQRPEWDECIARPCSTGEFLEEANRIAERLRAHVVPLPDGGATWLTFGSAASGEQASFGPMGAGLYDGRLGIAVFLASLYERTREAGLKELALNVVRPLSRNVSGDGPPSVLDAPYGLGLGSGIGGAILGLALVERSLSEPLLPKADALLGFLTEESISRDGQPDALMGGAGALIGLLSVPAFRKNGRIVDRAVRIGQRLLAERIQTRTGHRAWLLPAIAQEPLTGFAHGASGFAFALLRLFECSGDRLFLDAAVEAMAYENSLRREHGSWPDLRVLGDRTPTVAMSGWCAGSTGIGLARLLAARHGLNSAVGDLKAAVTDTLSASPACVDNLCCGRAARIVFLLGAGRESTSEACTLQARAHASWLVRATSRSWRFPSGVPGGATNLSLFQGWAGVGYALVHMTDADSPNLLMFECT